MNDAVADLIERVEILIDGFDNGRFFVVASEKYGHDVPAGAPLRLDYLREALKAVQAGAAK